MKINTKSKILLIATALLVLFVASAYGYSVLSNDESKIDSVNYSPPSEDEKKQGQDIKEQVTDSDNDKPTQGSDPLPAPQDPGDGSKPSVGVNVVSIIRNDDDYRVQSLLQTVTNTGQCILTITDSSGKAYRATADVQALPSSSTCKGFTIPASELSPGVWSVSLNFENESVQGSVQKDMEVS